MKKPSPITGSEMEIIAWFLAHNRQAFIKACQYFFTNFSEKEADTIIAKAQGRAV